MDRSRFVSVFAAALTAVVTTGSAHAQQYGYCTRLQAQYRSMLQSMGGHASMARIDRFNGQFGWRNSYRTPTGYDLARLRDRLIAQGCAGSVLNMTARTQPPSSDTARNLAGGQRTLCVRLCDGYYFPIEFRASRYRYKVDAAACQSMYAADGQAEMFIQSASRDVADARSPSGQRYGDQPYAFSYRDSYMPACAAQLHTGLSALAHRYFSQVPSKRKIATVDRKRPPPLPVPQVRPPIAEDPETLANAAGNFTFTLPAMALANRPVKPVRMVGPAYYARLFDLTRPPRSHTMFRRPTFSIVSPAAAAELPDTGVTPN